MKEYTISTVVVTYNRKELLLNNIKHQLSQTQPVKHIIIVDNHSSDGTKDYLDSQGIFKDNRIVYLYLDKNLGGAGGFEFGVKRSKEIGDDYVLLMDDDGYFITNDALEKLMNRVPSEKNLILMNSLVLADEDKLSFGLPVENINGRAFVTSLKQAREISSDGIISNVINPFNGTLVSKQLVDKIGFPNGSFFIKGDENDYQNRAMKAGAYIATVIDSLYHHPGGQNVSIKKVLGIEFKNNYEAPWKEYYTTRNYCFMIAQSSKLHAFMRYMRRRIGIHFFDVPDKSICIKFMKKGYQDAIAGRMGKVIEPGQTKL